MTSIRGRVLLATLDRVPGGIAAAIINYAQAFLAGGWAVEVLIPNTATVGPALSAISAPEFRLWRASRHFRLLSRIDRGLRGRLRAAVQEADAVLVFNAKLAPFFRRLGHGRTPIIVVNHGAKMRYLDQADHVITVAEATRRRMIDAGFDARAISTVHNAIELPQLPERHSRAPRPLLVVGAGRMVSKKGFADLLEAVALLREAGRDIRLSIAGDGPDRATLEALATELGLADVTEFPGWLSDLSDFFSEADIFCLPSTFEPFGIVLIEAMAHEVPCVATRCEGPSEILDDGRTGLLVPISDPPALAAAVERLIGDGALRRRIGEAARAEVAARFSLHALAERLTEVVNETRGDIG